MEGIKNRSGCPGIGRSMNEEERLIMLNTTYMAESNTKRLQERGCEMYFSENGKNPQNEENVLLERVWKVRAPAEKESKD